MKSGILFGVLSPPYEDIYNNLFNELDAPENVEQLTFIWHN